MACIGLPLALAVKTSPEPSPNLYEPALRCLVSAVYHEARGESVKGKRAVLDVVTNRAEKHGLSYCEVVSKKRQFPWYEKKGLVELTPDTLSHYNQALRHGQVLTNENFTYFNRAKPFGTKCVTIGAHKFCRSK